MKLNWRKWLFLLLILPLSRLPRGARYALSDFAAFILERVVKYRRGVIDGNLAIAFPHKSEAERAAIRHGFYRHFSDVALEQTAMFTASRERVLGDCRLVNPEIFDRYAEEGRPVVLCAGHHNNFEMAAAAVAMQIPIPAAGIYAPLANAYFDERVRETRARFGLHLWKRSTAAERTRRWYQMPGGFAVLFAFDQSPTRTQRKVWVPFFGRPTAAAAGLESYARRYEAVVLFGWIRRVARGRYEFELREVTDEPNARPFGAIVADVTRLLEDVIREAPESWLWSHRRWKLRLEDFEVGEEVVVGG